MRIKDALGPWGQSAHDQLLSTASTYQAVITYKELAELVQRVSGVRTEMLMMHWIGSVLEDVARRCIAQDQPPLTSLCVHQDGTIGDGYAKAARLSGIEVNGDIELLAAEHRLECYRRYATDLPPDGGQPTLTRQVADRRNRTAPGRPEPVVVMCPNCQIQLPRSGACGYC